MTVMTKFDNVHEGRFDLGIGDRLNSNDSDETSSSGQVSSHSLLKESEEDPKSLKDSQSQDMEEEPMFFGHL